MRLRHSSIIKGFVPIELLAIVATTFLLAGIVLPSLFNLRSSSAATRCLSNHRQIVRAWQLYAGDHDGRCVNNFSVFETETIILNGTFDNWVNNIMTWAVTDSVASRSVTNFEWVARGPLHIYTGGDIAVFRCPADTFLSKAQRASGIKERLRSVSMNGTVGVHYRSSPEQVLIPGYRQVLKVREVLNPAMTWLTIDEHPDSINEGFFINTLNSDAWGDIPGALHNRSTSFSFTDGHAELRLGAENGFARCASSIPPQALTLQAAKILGGIKSGLDGFANNLAPNLEII